mgnify:CR=1 FL=1
MDWSLFKSPLFQRTFLFRVFLSFSEAESDRFRLVLTCAAVAGDPNSELLLLFNYLILSASSAFVSNSEPSDHLTVSARLESAVVRTGVWGF